MALDAGRQYMIHRLAPPVMGKNFDFGIARKAFYLDSFAYRFNIDDAVSHHAAIIEHVGGRHQPVADMKGQQPVCGRRA